MPRAFKVPGTADAMILGGLVAAFLAVDAKGKSLQDIATPLSVVTNFRGHQAHPITPGSRPGPAPAADG